MPTEKQCCFFMFKEFALRALNKSGGNCSAHPEKINDLQVFVVS